MPRRTECQTAFLSSRDTVPSPSFALGREAPRDLVKKPPTHFANRLANSPPLGRTNCLSHRRGAENAENTFKRKNSCSPSPHGPLGVLDGFDCKQSRMHLVFGVLCALCASAVNSSVSHPAAFPPAGNHSTHQPSLPRSHASVLRGKCPATAAADAAASLASLLARSPPSGTNQLPVSPQRRRERRENLQERRPSFLIYS